MLPEFDQEMATTRRLLERVPSDKGTWKPHPKSVALGHALSTDATGAAGQTKVRALATQVSAIANAEH